MNCIFKDNIEKNLIMNKKGLIVFVYMVNSMHFALKPQNKVQRSKKNENEKNRVKLLFLLFPLT